jgi:2-polyprenyl-3-methyl-5-hydroxy-6-metoxy-1,4-benzoquinol methylase
MKALKKCDICGNKHFEILHKMNDKALDIKEDFNLFKCLKCGVIFINPQPSFKELGKHYKGDYYSLKKIQTKEESRKVKFRISLYDTYFNPKNKNLIKKILFLPIINYMRGIIISPGKKILDVGSGSGQFLYEIKELGLDVYGVEPGNFDKESVNKHNLKIKKMDLIAAKFSNNFFDLITINQVLEHVSNPTDTIKELYRILSKKGILIIGVPNTNSLAYKLFKKNWYQLDVPRHLFDFSDKNLVEKLKKEGFKIKRIRYNSRPTQFTISLKYLLGIKSFGKMEPIVNIFFAPLTYFCNFLKKGDAIEIWCTKPSS